MSSLAEQLLSEIATEEVINPDAGVYNDASFDGGDLGETKNGGFQLIARFSATRENGTVLKHREYINLPMSTSHPQTKKIGLGWYRALGLVPEASKNVPMANDRAAAEKIVEAANTLAGNLLALNITEDDKGFLRARPMRRQS